MNYQKNYKEIKKAILKLDFSKLNEDFAVQIYIDGEGEGTFYIEYKNKELEVEPFDYNDYTAFFKADKETLAAIFSNKLDIEDAVSDEKLIVEGDIKVVGFFKELQSKK